MNEAETRAEHIDPAMAGRVAGVNPPCDGDEDMRDDPADCSQTVQRPIDWGRIEHVVRSKINA